MPFTFLSHQPPVLPLKIAAPRMFDGTALVIGSMVPDLVFVTHGTDLSVDAHGVGPQFWLCLPVTLVLTWIVKRHVAGPVALHLPDLGPFHLRDFARLSRWAPPRTLRSWAVLVASALIGSFSHIGLDSFTHGFGWVVEHVDALRSPLFVLPSRLGGRTVFVFDLLQVGGTVVGGAITVWCLHVIGTRRLLIEWYPDAPVLTPTPRSRRILTRATALGIATGIVVGVVMIRVGGPQDLVIRIADGLLAGLAIGACRARTSMADAPDPSATVGG